MAIDLLLFVSGGNCSKIIEISIYIRSNLLDALPGAPKPLEELGKRSPASDQDQYMALYSMETYLSKNNISKQIPCRILTIGRLAKRPNRPAGRLARRHVGTVAPHSNPVMRLINLCG